MTRLSVNINKIATLRNARGGSIPDVIIAAKRIQEFGAAGITVHPRPDERHITRNDVEQLKKVVLTEFNIEGYPSEEFMEMVLRIIPDQVTLVPDPPEVLTSNAGWDCLKNGEFLKDIISKLKTAGIRTSIFMDPVEDQIRASVATGTDRIELYTESYASGFEDNSAKAIKPYVKAAEVAAECGLGLNAGHDLNLRNLNYFYKNIPGLLEVSIGHALISDALYIGLKNAVVAYKNCLHPDWKPDASK
ncbi:MAG: pyridoxine 5'-phosphate synthase [Bacteroidetes bacterium]|nr:pyridoxine 5'-phosphate synthase [Bacteroidota bacterium]